MSNVAVHKGLNLTLCGPAGTTFSSKEPQKFDMAIYGLKGTMPIIKSDVKMKIIRKLWKFELLSHWMYNL